MPKIILVTGGNAGIGFELVRLLAEKGHTVYLGARNPTSGKEAQDKLISDGLKTVKFVEIDVNKPSTITSAQLLIEAAEGKLDVLVNNAAIGNLQHDQNALTVEVSTIRETMETNLYGLIETTKAFVPLLRKSTSGAPVIVNVTTGMASGWFQSQPNPYMYLHWVAYNTSKAAVNSYTIALAHELKSEGFKVNAVNPGFTSTKLNGFREGGKSMRDGALALLPWALLEKEGGTGLNINDDQKELPW
ncbi:hypothetical protein CPB83DRAFT_888919 [Crepidotus variabilis]|uniref:NAD(P)-binding protein n=1 Tax=Crepidotus variabilis TaxID=179855 RepID=A0A9P6JWD4_9AGAR|nr:hypothetical protein CPB83DRAFT_888919 [Crepidotus variabilis]